MNPELSSFAARLRELIASLVAAEVTRLKSLKPDAGISDLIKSEPPHIGCYNHEFNALALELFALQFKHNSAYRKICEARKLTPEVVGHWTQIPAVPTVAFKELELTLLAPDERTTVFHSSGTTEQKPSRHFHSAESLKIYEASLTPWFLENVRTDLRFTIYDLRLICLTPPPEQVPHSSLVHMFETVRQTMGAPETAFVGKTAADGAWTLDFDAALAALGNNPQSAICNPQLILGTAFSFVHLLDYMVERDLRVELPAGSHVMETGGYKNRSRTMPKTELHALITERLGVPRENIICEYGMSELSSQAYDSKFHHPSSIIHQRVFSFPPWARVQIISPETGREVAEGETGLIRVFDLANVFSVAAIQTEDLAIRRGGGFELIGRTQLAEPRGCSLMTA
ncbi:MAG: hypothetical protein PHY43_12795 [Verrucomicrobiales bacterium]|nr:hypothetical protein [Verrucomicrobiales bacterium]